MSTTAPKKMGRPELPPEQRTKPRTIWMTDAEWAKVHAAPKGWVRGLVQRAKVQTGAKSQMPNCQGLLNCCGKDDR